MERIYSVDELRGILAPIFARYGVRRAVLFGSYGKDHATGKSKVDLLVDSGLRGLRFAGFSAEIHNALSKDVDVLDVLHIEPCSLVEREIRDTGVTFYEQ